MSASKNEIIWEFKQTPIDDEEILLIERGLKIQFPSDLRECIIHNNGACPSPGIFDLENDPGYVFDGLISFNRTDDVHFLDVYEWIEERLPPLTFPFANDPFGNHICLKYSDENDISPVIVFWDHDSIDNSSDSLRKICNTFSDLISSLHS